MNLSQITLNKIELTAKKAFPNEMCGVILSDGSFLELSNISAKPTTSFVIDTLSYIQLVDQVEYIIHSHTQNHQLHPCTPSLADLELSKNLQKPLLICAIKYGQYYSPIRVPSLPNPNYLNRTYIFGVQDCGILIRDYYYFEFGIELTIETVLHLYTKKYWADATDKVLKDNEFVNLINFSEQRLQDTVAYAELVEITKGSSLQKGDIFIISTLGKFKNHAMVWTGEAILNQSDVSKLEPLELYLSNILNVYRHPNLIK